MGAYIFVLGYIWFGRYGFGEYGSCFYRLLKFIGFKINSFKFEVVIIKLFVLGKC